VQCRYSLLKKITFSGGSLNVNSVVVRHLSQSWRVLTGRQKF
jgi:hypothetical protein